jgi:hypothetical protein
MKQIHYSPFLKLTIMKSEGTGACGEPGEISGYPGLITCPECLDCMSEENESHRTRREVVPVVAVAIS